jgi:hypothetical protein
MYYKTYSCYQNSVKRQATVFKIVTISIVSTGYTLLHRTVSHFPELFAGADRHTSLHFSHLRQECHNKKFDIFELLV